MEAEAQEKKSTLHEHVQRRDEVMRQADDLDPDLDEAPDDADAGSGQHRA
jgi:hypothetical protein